MTRMPQSFRVRSMKRVAWLVLTTLVITACGDSSGPRTPSMTGTWNGSIGSYSMSITLREQSGSITGNGVDQWSGGSSALTVTGTHNHPQVALTLQSQGYQDMAFTGEFGSTDNRVVGQLSGAGFSNESFTLIRQ